MDVAVAMAAAPTPDVHLQVLVAAMCSCQVEDLHCQAMHFSQCILLPLQQMMLGKDISYPPRGAKPRCRCPAT